MIRFLILFLVIVVLGSLAAVLADNPGSIAVDWGGWRVDTSAGLVVVAVLFVIAIAALIYRFWRWLRQAPRVLGDARAQSRIKRGHTELSNGLVAVAAGDAKTAAKHAKRAEALLDEPVLTLLLSAQAAQLAGDERLAESQYRSMLERPETEILGLRGLLGQAGRSGDRQAALKLAKRAGELSPGTPWVVEAGFRLEAEAGHWQDAETALDRAERLKLYPADEVKRNRAVLRYGAAAAAAAQGRSSDALGLVRGARKLAPDFIAAAHLEARLYSADGKTQKAERVLSDVWAKAPHPSLGVLWQQIHGDLDADKRLARLDVLLPRNQNHRESRVLEAGAAFRAEDWQRTRTALEALLAEEADPDQRVCRLMAEFEETYKGNAAAARDWLVKAAHAPQAGRWRCRECGHFHADYEALCPACGAFAGLTDADQEAAARARSAGLLSVATETPEALEAPKQSSGSAAAG